MAGRRQFSFRTAGRRRSCERPARPLGRFSVCSGPASMWFTTSSSRIPGGLATVYWRQRQMTEMSEKTGGRQLCGAFAVRVNGGWRWVLTEPRERGRIAPDHLSPFGWVSGTNSQLPDNGGVRGVHVEVAVREQVGDAHLRSTGCPGAVFHDDLHVAAISSMAALDVATLRVRSLALWFSERRAAAVKTCSRSSETESSHLPASRVRDPRAYSGARRPAGKAPRARILAVFERGATRPAGMPRPGVMR